MKVKEGSETVGLILDFQKTRCKQLAPWKRPWCWERLEAGEEGDDKGWDGWMASLTRWTWEWASSWSWWWTGKPDVLQSMRRSNQSILKEINPKYSLEWLMLKLKLQYFDHLMQRADSLDKIDSRRRRGWQRMRWLDGTTDSMEFEQTPGMDDKENLSCCSPWGYEDWDMNEWLNWLNWLLFASVLLRIFASVFICNIGL